jgi:hypothetical protein
MGFRDAVGYDLEDDQGALGCEEAEVEATGREGCDGRVEVAVLREIFDEPSPA